jgi:hypothetical protein
MPRHMRLAHRQPFQPADRKACSRGVFSLALQHGVGTQPGCASLLPSRLS